MRWGIGIVLAGVALGGPGCSCGKRGPAGPAGPLNDPPKIFSLDPDSGSSRNLITITGENFVDGANEVYFDGTLADILSESATQIVVQPTAVVLEQDDAGRTVDVTVISGQQASNAYAFLALPSGTPRFLDTTHISRITDVATDGTLVYVADDANGIISVDPANSFVTARVRALGDGLRKPDAMAYSATDGLIVACDMSPGGTGAAYRLVAVDSVSGNVQVLVGELFGLADVVDIAVDPGNGDIYVIQEDGTTTKPIARLSSTMGFEPAWGGVVTGGTVQSAVVVDTTVYVGSDLGVYQLKAGDLGGGNVTTIKALDTTIGAAGLVANGSDLYAIDGSTIVSITNLGMNPSNVTQYSTFPMQAGSADLANAGGTLYYSAAPVAGTSVGRLLLRVADADTQTMASASPGLIGTTGMTATPSGVYFSSYVECANFGPTASQLLRLNPDGTMQVAAETGSCGFHPDVLSDGTIVTSDYLAVTISTVDPATGAVTTIVDAGDGLELPASVFVGPNDTIYFGHIVGGADEYLGSTDATGSTIDLTFSDLTSINLNALQGGVLGNQLITGPIPGVDVFSVDLGTGVATADFVDSSQLPGGLYGMQVTADGTIAVSYFAGPTAGAVEILDTGAVRPLFAADSSSEIPLPVGMAVLPTNDLLMINLGSSAISEGDPVIVTP